MKMLSLLLSFALLIFLTGCQSLESASGAVKERWKQRSVGRTHAYAADSRAVHEACTSAAKSMGFKVIKGGAAQGIMEAVSRLRSEDSLKGSQQIIMKLRIGYAPEGSEIRLFLTEVIEEDFGKGAGRSTETPLVDTPLYEVFFRTVEQNLKSQK